MLYQRGQNLDLLDGLTRLQPSRYQKTHLCICKDEYFFFFLRKLHIIAEQCEVIMQPDDASE